jgi:triphosphatase
MGTEIELKLAIAPEDARSVRAFAGKATSHGAQPRPTRNRVYNLYFDTPDLLLKRHRMALRMRKLSRQWLQTLKTAGASTGGLHSRGEWEFALPDATLDLAHFSETPLGQLKQRAELHTLLKPAFVTDFQRTTWTIAPTPGNVVELALDQGTIQCEGRTEAISEVEIELLEGDASAVFDVAGALISAVTAQPASASKAERGYRLFQQAPLVPVKAEPADIDAGQSVMDAMRAIVGGCVTHYSANLVGATESGDPEFIHQARVALRRLRSALRVFGHPEQRRFDDDLHWLTGKLGAARDWDVFVGETWPAQRAALPPDMEAAASDMGAAASKRRELARKEARAALISRRHALLWLDVMRWLTTDNAPAGLETSLTDFASRQIRKRHKRLMNNAADLASLSAEARHQVRIDAKRLRYAVDFFRALFKKSHVESYLDALSAIQDALGEANDAVVAARLVEELAPPAVLKAYLDGWTAGLTQQSAQHLETLFETLRDSKRFWREGNGSKTAGSDGN